MNQQEVLKRYVSDEMSKFRNAGDLDAFVDSLTPDQMRQQCALLTSWRKNCVYRFIASSTDSWTETSVSIQKIIVGQINPSVDPILRRHAYRLAGIVEDPEAKAHAEFRSQGDISSRRLIAYRMGEDFKLVDGNHRAIRMGVDGQLEFTLLIPD